MWRSAGYARIHEVFDDENQSSALIYGINVGLQVTIAALFHWMFPFLWGYSSLFPLCSRQVRSYHFYLPEDS